MTAKNKDQLYASFPDNTSKLILPLNMRDFVDSVELKYDNFTVVKPGQPNGNKFPDPVGGKIILPAGSVWLVNGAVTVNYPIHLENNATIIGLTQSLVTDSLTLDASAGAVALINSGNSGSGDGYIGQIGNLILDAGSGSGRLFGVKNASFFTASRCVLVGNTMGAFDNVGGTNSDIYFDECSNFITGTPLQFTGNAVGRLVISGCLSGYGHLGAQYEILGTFSQILVESCYNASGFPMITAVEGSTPIGIAIGNSVAPGSSLISGVSAANSINWTFSGNSGVANTIPLGSLNIDANVTVTDLLGIDVWAIVAGTSVLSSASCRFDRPSPLTLRYIGKDTFKGIATVSLSVTPTNNPASIYEVSLFKNGVLYAADGVSFRTSATMTTGTRQSLSFNCPISAVLNDTFDVRIRNRTSATPDVVITELNFAIR